MRRIRCLIELRYFLPQLASRKIEDRGAIEHQEQEIEPQDFETDAFEEDSFDDVDEIPGRHEQSNRLNHARHIFDRVDESGEQKCGQKRSQRSQLISGKLVPDSSTRSKICRA